MEKYKVAVIIPNWNGLHHIKKCLAALSEQTYTNSEIIVVDNGSTDGSLQYLKGLGDKVRVIELSENMGFSVACNKGIQGAQSEYICLLNNDTKPYKDWLEQLVFAVDRASHDVACLASKMLSMGDPDLVDDAGDLLTWRLGAFKRGHGQRADNYTQKQEVMMPCAGAALYRRCVLDKVGLFDEDYFAYLEDVDLGLRIRLAGYKCLFVPEAKVLHIGHGSRIAHDRYVYLIARNRIFLFVKNIPFSLLLKNIFYIIYGWFFYLIAYRSYRFYIRGTLAAFKHFPELLRKRRMIKTITKLDNSMIEKSISKEWPEITMGRLILDKLKSRFL